VKKPVVLERIKANVSALRGGTIPPAEVVDRLFDQKMDWFELTKTLRMIYELRILDVETLALSHEGWRRWCNSWIKTDPRCRKMAWQHMKYNGEDSLIETDGDGFRIR
jgi:predicted phosphoadenosine phosphosulfate sulfurtransferase